MTFGWRVMKVRWEHVQVEWKNWTREREGEINLNHHQGAVHGQWWPQLIRDLPPSPPHLAVAHLHAAGCWPNHYINPTHTTNKSTPQWLSAFFSLVWPTSLQCLSLDPCTHTHTHTHTHNTASQTVLFLSIHTPLNQLLPVDLLWSQVCQVLYNIQHRVQ